MRYFRGVAIALLAGLVGTAASAQGRTVTGTVTDSINGSPVVGATVLVRGTTMSAFTRDNGAYVLPAAPDGPFQMIVRAVGYRRREVTVGAGQASVDVSLAKDVFKVDEVVITGQATGISRQNLANAVSTVNAEDLAVVPTPSVEQQIQGKVAGADIQTNSGAPGGGVQVRLRGVSSINAAAQPLYVVDGVVVSDVAIPSNQNAVTNAAGGSNPALTQDAQVNRIADLNPADIESIEILKGASAAAIYGGRASNGVVIITTKRGVPGTTRWNLSQRFGFFDLANKIGSRRFETAAEVDAVFGPGTAAAVGYTPGRFFDHEEELAGRNALGSETNVSLSGGDLNTRFYASGQVKNDEGIIANTGFQRQSLRVNVDQRLGDRVSASVNTNVLHTKAARGLTNNDNATVSFYMTLPFTPSFVDLRERPDGTFPNNPIVGSNPLQTAALMKNDEDVWRFLGAGKIELDLFRSSKSNLRFLVNGGLDYFSQENSLFFPPELQFEPQDGQPGTALLSNSNSLNLNLDGNLVHTYSPESGSFSATTSAGVQYARRDLDITRIVSRNLVGGQSNVDAGTNKQVLQNRQTINNLGFFAQEEVLLANERLLLTAGVRADQSSLNADAGKLFYYPKAAASYRFVNPASFIDQLKVRAAYGESGNEPLYGQKFTPLTATNNIGGLPGLVVAGTTGSLDLRPERQREIEGGIDATLWNSRLGLEVSAYRRNISDLLLQRTLAPSSGFATEIFNGGKMKVLGLEAAVGVVPIQSANLSWLFRTTFSTTRSEITELPVPAFLTGGFGTSIGAFRIEEGASATQIVGNDTLPDGSIVVNKIGDATPKFRMSMSSDIQYKSWSLRALGDWQYGANILNLTKLLYDFGQLSPDYADPIPGDPTQTVGEKRLAGFTRTAANYLESASFFKLRELTLSYELPVSFVQNIWAGARYARLSLSARNLFTITPYTGLDPEVSNFGNQPVARNIDVAPFPPSRSYFFSIDLGF